MWIGTSELVGLPGLPGSKKGLIKKAQKENWQWRDRNQRGGGKEYHISSLPPQAQAYLLQQAKPDQQHSHPESENEELLITQSPLPIQMPTETLVTAIIPSQQRASETSTDGRINAKVEILRVLEQFCEERQLKKISCHHVFADSYNTGKIQVSEQTRRQIPSVSFPTLQRWYKALQEGSVQSLGGKYGNRAGQTKIDTNPKIRDFVLAMLTRFPHATGGHILSALQARFEDEILPSQRTISRWIEGWKNENKELFTAISNPDDWKNKFMTAFGSYSEDVVRLNQRWEMDSTSADIMLEDGRYHLISCIDVFSRRMKLLVVPTSKATAIAVLVRKCLLDWGVPEEVKTDNGKDYTANYLERVFRDLGIRQKLCIPFHPWQKPHVERGFRSFLHDLLELLDGYIGHNVAERQALRARISFADRLTTKTEEISMKMTASEFQAFCDTWTNQIYANKPHEGLDGKTPFQVFTAWRSNTKSIDNERILDVLLAEAPGANGLRTVQKRGIQLEGTFFIAPELEAWIGQTVQVRFDPLDLGKIYVFDGDFKLICIAEDPVRTGMNRQEVAVRAKHLQQKRIHEGKRALKQIAKKVNVAEAVEDILQEAEANNNVVAFPAPKEIHTSRGLESAAEVVAALKPKEYAPMTAEELAEADAALSRIEQPEVEIVRDEDHFCRLWKQVNAGAFIANRDWQWMKHYATTPEGRGVLRFLDVTEIDFSSFMNEREAKIS
ncbi:Mu transposase C-terminal domain-containing protein [Anabaena lutea]|uniref:DDE-type integrase/transposase/recombinase n=1 Tax=Anabaena lutea FACHB-196 TaxID=2692881 RepID=A0ABR8FLH5_9NOST|nr:Mu transposase C-terminal domain-containing protein [Anabaena lutea]MBD2570022.1 DDE-type integrase/transposase/recombinase [Anabaena lutea FACHB-196]